MLFVMNYLSQDLGWAGLGWVELSDKTGTYLFTWDKCGDLLGDISIHS